MTELQTMPLRFRVWDKVQGEFVTYNRIYRIDWQTEEMKNTIELDLEDLYSFIDTFGYFKDDNFIISQDTGLKDKNDKSIFTGDIVRVKSFGVDGENIAGIVECHYGECRIHYENGLQESLVFNVGREVVGNIWEGANEN